MRARRLATVSMLLASVLAGAPARAQQGPALNFVREPGAESCIASVELARLIEARLGKPVFVAAPRAVIAIEGTVRPDPAGGFVAVIAVSDGRGALYGSRELHAAKDCRELDEQLALVIAVTLRPEGGAVAGIALPDDVARALERLFGDEPVDPEPESLPAPRASERSSGAAAPAIEERAAPPPAAESPWSLAIEPAFFATSGLQPDAGYGPTLALRFGKRDFGSARVQGALALPTTLERRVDDMPTETTFMTVMAALAYCSPELIVGPFAGALCPGLKLGVTSADAEGFEQNFEVSQTWLAFDLSASVRLPLFGPVAAYLAVYGEGRLSRANFSFVEASRRVVQLFQAKPIGIGAELGAVLTVF